MRFITELEELDGVLYARVYELDSGPDPVALFACAPSEAGQLAIFELWRLAVKNGLRLTDDSNHASALSSG